MATLGELAKLSAAVYGDSPVPNGWTPLGNGMNDTDSGYRGQAYINTSGEIVIANRGTQSFRYGFGMLAIYGALAAGAKEGGKLEGAIGWTGAVVSLVIGGMQSEKRCDVIGTIAKSIYLSPLFTVFAR